MKHRGLLLIPLIVSLMTSCGKKMNSQEIYDKESSGVVLIVNDFYYSAKIGGLEVYFSGVNSEGDIEDFTSSEEEIKENCSGCTGTGFFISEDGQIMTNRHVVSPNLDKDAVRKELRLALKESFEEKKKELTSLFNQYEGNDAAQQQIYEDWKIYKDAYDTIDNMSISDIVITTHSELYIIYNDQHVVKYEDLTPCFTVAVSEDENIDLAIIQLKDGETPEGTHIFSLHSEEDDDLEMGQKLFMIGFNEGGKIAKTTQGYRSQMYDGKVTQKSDGEQVLYSIASLPGSSGSPIIDEYGYLVAVNYAGLSNTQNFNYGIPARLVRQFLNEN